MPKPTKPVTPPPALRRNPDTFSANAEEVVSFIPVHVDYMDVMGDWISDAADRATAAAALATGGAGLDLTGQAGKYLRVNAGETGTEFVARPTGDALEAANTGLVAKTAAGAVAPRTITAGSGISVTNGNGVAGNPTVAAVTRTQAQWNAGTDTTEATISPSKLRIALASVRPPDAHFAGAGGTETGTLPITVTLRNTITGRAALASNTFTLQPGQYYVQISASVRSTRDPGGATSASVALVTEAGDGIGIVFSARGASVTGIGGQGTSGFYLSPATATGYRLNFARDNTAWVAAQGSLTSAHADMTNYDHEIMIWRIA